MAYILRHPSITATAQLLWWETLWRYRKWEQVREKIAQASKSLKCSSLGKFPLKIFFLKTNTYTSSELFINKGENVCEVVIICTSRDKVRIFVNLEASAERRWVFLWTSVLPDEAFMQVRSDVQVSTLRFRKQFPHSGENFCEGTWRTRSWNRFLSVTSTYRWEVLWRFSSFLCLLLRLTSISFPESSLFTKWIRHFSLIFPRLRLLASSSREDCLLCECFL